MIKIQRDKNVVKISLDTGLGIFVDFENERYRELDAILLRDKLHDRLGSILQEIRREAYCDGWKDKASKKVPKQQYFSRHF